MVSDARLLIGSLSNDLYRSACSIQRNSPDVAIKFLQESQRWVNDLRNTEVEDYVKKIVADVEKADQKPLTMENAEKYLMYSVLLQNYALHMS